MQNIILEEDGKTVLIKDIQIQDENLYKFLKETEENKRIDRLVDVLRIGVIGLKRMVVGEEIDYVEKEFNSLLVKIEKMLGEYFDKGGTVENLFDPTEDDSPLGKLRKGLQEEFKELRDIIKAKEVKEELIEKTTLKGRRFEDMCEEILSIFVSRHIGDELERKTNKIGNITGSFAGDFLITLRGVPNKKIVLEVRDCEDTLSQLKIIESLDNAMENRGASYGIFVSKYKEALPKNIGWFNEFRGNMLVCALGSKETDTFFPDMLNIAYQWAKLRVTTEITIEEKALETIIEGIREIGTRLDMFSQIQRQCTNVDKATKEIRDISNELKNNIEEQINKIRKAIVAVSEDVNK